MAAKPRKAPNRSSRRPIRRYEGYVQRGRVKVTGAIDLPDGTPVRIVPVRPRSTRAKSKTATGPTALARMLLKHAGILKGLPSDFAEQHDHYSHGLPKRS